MSNSHPKRPTAGSGRLLSVKEQKSLIPDDGVHKAFLKREDISVLSKPEQEKRWAEHQVALDKFRNFLAGVPAFVVRETLIKLSLSTGV